MRRQVLDELRSTAPHAGETAGQPEVHTRADDAEAERIDDLRFAEIEVDRTRLQDIENAQQRMRDGRYGFCADCAEEIPRERLLAQPTAIRCAACQAGAEHPRLR
jgi:DnaK suppressor protein